MDRPKTVTMQYMLLFSHRNVALPARRKYAAGEPRITGPATGVRAHGGPGLERSDGRGAPSVVLSQKQDVAVCRPAPFFCMSTAVTAHAYGHK